MPDQPDPSVGLTRILGNESTLTKSPGRLTSPPENTLDGQDQEIIVQQMEQFFLGDGAVLPANFVPQKSKSSPKFGEVNNQGLESLVPRIKWRA
jgi:hypothetical protein